MTGRRLILVMAIAAIAASSIWMLTRRGDKAAADKPKIATQEPVKKRTAVKTKRVSSQEQRPTATELDIDDDPVGTLRLEGQVLGEGDAPVDGAIVYLSSRPARTTKTKADGTFVFEKLIPKRYRIHARAGEQVGGPMVYTLTAKGDPAVLRLHQGALLTVTIADKQLGKPVTGATVAIENEKALSSKTNANGDATLRGLSNGGSVVVVRAKGYATARRFVQVPSSAGVHLRQRIELTVGLDVSGRVVDAKGKPVVGARVIRAGSGVFGRNSTRSRSVKTDAKGRFTLEAIAPGRHRLMAMHREFAPTTSEPVRVTETSAPTNVEIRLEAGGVVLGRVVDKSGEAAAYAEVKLATAHEERGYQGGSSRRTVVADKDGTFEVTGLHRTVISAFARTPEASSAIVKVDLRSKGKRDGVLLTLDVTGAISGVVVDEAGEPIAEAQVIAEADFWKGNRLDDVVTRGSSFATTDGGGRFTINGLPEGSFVLRASRSELRAQQWLRGGKEAKSGATDVRIVLPAEGGIKGTIQTTGGKTPGVATVSITWAAGVPAKKGVFQVDGVPPGTYDVTIRGLDFPSKIVKDVVIAPGKVTDMGTVKVARGRMISGVVKGADGSPVAGAHVAIGRRLISDSDGFAQLGEAQQQQMGIRTTLTDEDGGFRLRGVGSRELALAAGHAKHGSSEAVAVRPGEDDAVINLSLSAPGSVSGTITKNGAPAAEATVIVRAVGGAAMMTVARTGTDGSFDIARIAAGTYKLTAMIGSGAAAAMKAQEIRVVAGDKLEVKLDIALGSITVEVAIKGKDGAKIDAAQVFLFDGKINVTTGGQLNKVFLSASSAGGAKMSFALGGKPATFKRVEPGDYSLCVIPINGDMNDPQFAQRLQRNVDSLAVYCHSTKVAGSPAAQTQEAVVPPMTPLPQ